MPESNKENSPKPSSNEIPENASIEWQKETQTQKTRKQLKEELKNMTEEQLVSRMVSLLKRKYPDNKEIFSPKTIKVWDYPKLYETEWTRLYLQYSGEGRLLSYLDNSWETLVDMTTFFDDYKFKNKLYAKWKEINGTNQRVTWIELDEKTGKLVFIEKDWSKHLEWSHIFNEWLLFIHISMILTKKSISK